MKLKFRKPEKLTRRHKHLAVVSFAIMITAASFLIVSKLARAAEPPDYKFAKIMPSPDTATQQRDAHLEIAQAGEGNTLDAEATWGKYYFDPSKVSDGYVGISKGGYGGQVDTRGTSSGLSNQRFAEADAVKYEFFLAINQQDQTGNYVDEIPCRVGSSLNPVASYTANSSQMSVTGWYKLPVSTFIGKKCGTKTWTATQKSGKFVLFVKASWDKSKNAPTEDRVVNGKTTKVTLGRVNAFKLGAAYNGDGDPLTGYWANSDWAYTSDRPNTASYAVQDRLSPDATNGDYTFEFAPDCRLGKDQKEARFLHWSDVDWPAYYRAPWPVQPAPEFDLIEIPPTGGAGKSVLHRGPADNVFNGLDSNGNPRQNVHNSVQYPDFKGGGYKYKWVWKNIARVDGINFWIPYDDFPAINTGGCGDYKHELQIKAGQDAATGTGSFVVEGDHKVAVNLTQLWSSKTNSAGPNTSVKLTLAPKAGSARTFSDSFDAVTATSGGHTVATGASRTLQWPSDEEKTFPSLGPSPIYNTSRPDTFAYFNVKQNAPDGAEYCLTASMTPGKNSDDSAVKVTPGSICFTIKNSLKPYVTTTGADVHAGDCLRAGSYPMNINGVVSPARGSSGSYIVSAGGAINAFGSGGDATGDSLTLGKGGKYGKMCRPSIDDILSSINKEIDKGSVEVIDVVGTRFDLGDIRIIQGKRYLVKFAGSPTDTVTGRSKASVSVYSPGTLTIESGFGSRTDVPAAKDKLPVVGVIARAIKINPSVSTIDATLYAVDNLDTCSGGTVASCKTRLTINGFAMAHDFSFKRTTGTNGLNEAEKLNFNAAFYLNPSTGFTIPSSDMKYLGERAPLY